MASGFRAWFSRAGTTCALVTTLVLGGCAAMSYNSEPRVVKLGSAAASSNALVLGQAYKESAGHYICYIIKDVDGTKTFGVMEPRAPYNFFIPAGQHTFKVWAALGNFGHSREGDPQFSADLRAGHVYQLYGKVYEDSNGDSFVKVWVEHIGSIAQYDAFRERHPDEPGGRPLSQRQMTGR
jgi:hypothetical protein